MTAQGIAALPIPVRPATGEHYTSYLRRLAEPNHLPPSALRTFVNADALSAGALQLDRLAAAAGREPTALRRALTGLPAPHRPTPPGAPLTRFQEFHRRRDRPGVADPPLIQDWKLAADEVRYLDEVELFAAIRADRQAGTPTAELPHRHFVSERLVKRVLRGSQPRPAALVPQDLDAAAPPLDPVKDLIDRMHGQGMNCDQIWACLVNHHRAAVSKPTVKRYLRRARSTRQTPAGDGRQAHRGRTHDLAEAGP